MMRKTALLVFVLTFAPGMAGADSLSCPLRSPTPLGFPQTALRQVSVLSWPISNPVPIDAPPPITVPDDQRQIGGAWHQVWKMNIDSKDQVECHYGPGQVLRLDASAVKRCELVGRDKGRRFVISRFSCK